MERPLVGVIMGSVSDWETMKHAAETLRQLGIPYEVRIVSAHRTPDWMFEYAATAEERGLEVIIAGAGGAAHLPGMTASKTVNAALLAAAILGNKYPEIRERLKAYRQAQTQAVLESKIPEAEP
jgi:5-(carboxyamino)imidazole ribonucleotide mutase